MNVTPGFEFMGRFRPCTTDKETLLEGLMVLARHDPRVLAKLVSDFDRPDRQRRQIARRAEDVHGDRHDLDHEITEIQPGYFVGTNENSDMKLEVLMRACRHAGLIYGEEFRAMCLEGDGSKRQQLETEFSAAGRLGL